MGYSSLPNFPCFCVSCEFGPSLQHPPAGWFTINRFTELLRIKAVWLVLSSQQSPNSHSPTPPNYSDVKNPGVLKKKAPIPSPFVLSNLRAKMKTMKN